MGNGKNNFGDWLAMQLQRNDMRQKDLAAKLDVEACVISQWRTGYSRPNRLLIMPLAKALKVNASDVLKRL